MVGMARGVVVAFALVGLVYVFAGGAGCTGTGTNESGSNACVGASVKLIQASDYDQSCTVDTDCQPIAEGNACAPCAFSCQLGAAINVGALAQYNSDVANTPAVAREFDGQSCVVACPGAFPCCVGGTCQIDGCPARVSTATCTLGAACSSTDLCPGGIAGCESNCQCLNGTWSAPCPTGLPPTGSACAPVGTECGYSTSTNACGADNCYCESGAWNCEPTCVIGDASTGVDTGADADASPCTVDSSEVACCCDGDVGGNGPFCSGESLSCAPGFGLYFGADCTRECGPCAVACPDSGTSGPDAARDGGAADASGE